MPRKSKKTIPPPPYTPTDPREAITEDELPDTQDEVEPETQEGFPLHFTPPPSTMLSSGVGWMTYRGLGHKEDPPDERDFPVCGRRGTGETWDIRPVGGLLPASIATPDYLEIPTGKIRDQEGTSECVAFGFARHINARLARLSGRDPDACIWPSETGIYGLARRNDTKDDKGNFLLDDGCYPREGALGMVLHGIVREERLMFDSAKVNDALPWDVLTAGYDAKIMKFHRMLSAYGREAEFLDEMERLIASGFTVPFAQDVDRPFNDYTSGVLGVHKGEIRGSHYTVIRGYDRKRRVAFCDNSWGTGWGLYGRYEVSYDRLVTTSCRDFIVLTTLPEARSIR
jgi:hypothetical protein